MEIKELCKNCGYANVLKKEEIRTVFVNDENEKEYRVMYYVCGGCNRNVLVQIDDDVTLKILQSLIGLTMKAIKKSEDGESVPKQWEKKKNALNFSLTSKRKQLEKKMRGKLLVNEDKNIKILV